MSDKAIKKLHAIMQESKYPVDAFEFIASVLATALAKGPLTRSPRTTDAVAVCTTAREMGQLRYRSGAIALLREWKLASSFDIGEIVFEFVRAEWITSDHGESAEDFRGVYEVGDASWLAPTALRGRCGICNYDLRGTPSYICPECGARND